MPQIILLLLAFLPLFSMAQPEINVLGNGQTIIDGDITPDTIDHTYFDTIYCFSPNNITTTSRSYIIQNTGTSSLIISDILIQGGGMPWAFQVIGITFPDTIAPGASDTFSINIGMGLQDNYNNSVSILNNDVNEGNYNFDITAVVSSNVSATIAYTPYMLISGMATATAVGGISPYSYSWSNGETGNSTNTLGGGCPLSWGAWNDTIIYILWIVDSAGCGIAMDVPIPCVMLWFYPIYSIDTTITGCLPVPPSFSMSYNVVDGAQNGTFLMTSDSCFQYTPFPSFSGSDTVIVEVCDSLSGICTFYTIIFNADTSALAINTISKPISDMSIFPNPNIQGQLTVDWTTAIQPKHILIIDALGREVGVYSVADNAVSQQIDIQHLPSGYYSVLLREEAQIIGREKLIVIKQ